MTQRHVTANEGPDTYYHPVGKKSLEAGSRMSLLVGEGSAEYQRVLECRIPIVSEEALQNYNNNNRGDLPYKKGEVSDVWEVLRFRNPLGFPMTTAPATVTAQGRFLGQNTSYWTGAGAELTVPVTRAMSVQVVSDEQERDGNIEPWQIIDPSGEIIENKAKRPTLYRFFNDGSTYRKQVIDAKITVKNLRSERVKIRLTRLIAGESFHAEIMPEIKILADRTSQNFNRNTELKWDLTPEPGETLVIDFSYERFIRH
ncbi:MAG: hypothetical protein LBQ54_08740 [Planctomycetaceae bacterium]|nr:hypothetical protein [Planctomycetaceae bacterium]